MSISTDPERLMFGYIAGRYGPPAFVRRQQQVEASWTAVLEKCRAEYDRLLTPVRRQIAYLAQSLHIPTLDGLEPADALRHVSPEVQRRWREPRAMPRRARNEIERLAAVVRRFNRRWTDYVASVDLTEVNRLREGYNQYYVLEKECALRSERLARLGFEPLRPASRDDLFLPFPTLLFTPAC
jgi:hypothetical protein